MNTNDASAENSSFFNDETPEKNPNALLDFPIIPLSSYELAYDIWIFKRSRSDSRYFCSSVYNAGMFDFLKRKGYYKRYRLDRSYVLIHEVGNVIEEVEIHQLKDIVTEYIRSITQKLSFNYKGETIETESEKLLETYLKMSHLIFNHTALGHLENHKKPILKDKKEEMYFCFTNCVAKVSKKGVEILSYAELKNYCVWKEHIINKPYHFNKGFNDSHFAAFLNNIANQQDDRRNAFRSAIGYLLHNITLPGKAVAIIAYDEEITDSRKPEGGTGKGILIKGIGQARNITIIDGKRFDKEDRFCFQNISDSSQVAYFDDVKPDFDFLRLNSAITEGWQIEQKNKPSFRIEASESPKIYITSNSILKGEGTTIERRQFILEFSPYYSKLARRKLDPIIHTHGCIFFDKDEWDQEEWDKFFTYLLTCGNFYLSEGLQHYKLRSVADNKVRQNTSDDFSDWIQGQSFQPDIEFNLSEQFHEFKNLYYGDDTKFTQRHFNNWMKTYASAHKLTLKTRRSNSINYGTFIHVG